MSRFARCTGGVVLRLMCKIAPSPVRSLTQLAICTGKSELHSQSATQLPACYRLNSKSGIVPAAGSADGVGKIKTLEPRHVGSYIGFYERFYCRASEASVLSDAEKRVHLKEIDDYFQRSSIKPMTLIKL